MAMDLLELDPPMPVGTVVGDRYVVDGLLGRGGMGFVVSALHRDLGERVAIKFLQRAHASLADRFFREARAAARLRSDHVVRIFDVGRLTTGEPYIVMERLSGEDLEARLVRLGTMPIEVIAPMLVDVCHVLAEAHAAGIVHRDLKPANIFLARRPGGEVIVKLLDFGVAKVPDAGTITQTSNVLGSPAYMSPEQLLGSRNVDHRSDIWSLGVILYELLTGDVPFAAESIVHLGILLREKPTPSIRELRPELPEELDAVVARCLEKKRTDRFADVGELAEALAPFLPEATSQSLIPRIRRIVDEQVNSSPENAPTMPPPMSEPRLRGANGEASFGSGSGKPLARSQQSETAPSASDGSKAPKRRRVVIVVMLALASLVAFAIMTRGRQRVVAAAPPAPEAHDAAPIMTAAAPVSALPPVVSTPSVASEPPPRPPPIVVRPAAPPQPPRSATPAASAPPKATVSCVPPYTIDENGVRHAKRECL
jgi:eukaryotic-like serine/threonine-protein kinase